MRTVLVKLGGAAVPHGFQSSSRNWAAEDADHDRGVLAQVVRNKVEAAYRHTDLFERWRRLMGGLGSLSGQREPRPGGRPRAGPSGLAEDGQLYRLHAT